MRGRGLVRRAVVAWLIALAAPAAAEPRRLVVHPFEGGRDARALQTVVVDLLGAEGFAVVEDPAGASASVGGALARNRRKHFLLTVSIADQPPVVLDLGRRARLTRATSARLRRQLLAKLRALPPAPAPAAASGAAESSAVSPPAPAPAAASGAAESSAANPPTPAIAASTPTPAIAAPPMPEAAPPLAKPASRIGLSLSLTSAAQLERGGERTVMMVGGATYTRRGGLGLSARMGWLHDAKESASSVSNVLLGATMPLAAPGPLGLTVRLAATLPVGSAGGGDADAGALAASLKGTDWNGPMFAPNHLAVAAGARLSFERAPLFVHLDSALYSITRVRGAGVDTIGPAVAFTPTKLVIGVAIGSVALYAGGAQTRYWGDPAFLGDNPMSRDDYYGFGGLDWTLGRLHLGALHVRALDDPKASRGVQVTEVSAAVDF